MKRTLSVVVACLLTVLVLSAFSPSQPLHYRLASDPALGNYGYPAYVVVFGKRTMPAFGDMMSNDQVAAVVNYLRTHFGNNYLDKITAEEIEAIRR